MEPSVSFLGDAAAARRRSSRALSEPSTNGGVKARVAASRGPRTSATLPSAASQSAAAQCKLRVLPLCVRRSRRRANASRPSSQYSSTARAASVSPHQLVTKSAYGSDVSKRALASRTLDGVASAAQHSSWSSVGMAVGSTPLAAESAPGLPRGRVTGKLRAIATYSSKLRGSVPKRPSDCGDHGAVGRSDWLQRSSSTPLSHKRAPAVRCIARMLPSTSSSGR
mmetsp:Transcript_12598/g.26909  ORF Transcript_12598/g.26909 Transcript_12598/m.26909 type:complete len:224 (+) Transcript_12598:1001-1672(+)